MQRTGHCSLGYAIRRSIMPSWLDATVFWRMWRIKVRTFIRFAGIAGVLTLAAACSDKSTSATSDDFKKDLARASTASEITLPQAQQSQQVVSAIERTAP